jgi:MFS transporter, FHS family, glucose/mannose:H+ symporter
MNGRAADRTLPAHETARLSLILHIGFVLTGIVTTLLGPILPILSAHWSLTDSQAGRFFTSQFTGSIVGVGLSSAFLPRYGYKRALNSGFVLMLMGVATMGLGSWREGLLSVFGYGIGLGLTIPTTNLLVADLYRSCRAASLNILNMAWGIGAVACPPLVVFALRVHHLQAFLFTSAAVFAILIIGLTCSPFYVSPAAQSSIAKVNTDRIRHGSFTVALGLMFFIYVGTENGVSGWAAAYSKRLGNTSGAAWVLGPSFFGERC